MILSSAKVPYYQNQIIDTNISNIEKINYRFIQCCIADKSKLKILRSCKIGVVK